MCGRASLGLAAPFAIAAAVLLLASQAEGAIVPQKGIAGIALNMTRAEIVRAKGQPDAEKVLPHDIIGRQRMMRYGSTRAFLGTRPGATVFSLRTLDPREQTATGVGVGSTVAEVRAGVAGVKCRREFGIHHCWKGAFRAGERVTDFSIETKTYVPLISPAGTTLVSAVTIGFVID